MDLVNVVAIFKGPTLQDSLVSDKTSVQEKLECAGLVYLIMANNFEQRCRYKEVGRRQHSGRPI